MTKSHNIPLIKLCSVFRIKQVTAVHWSPPFEGPLNVNEVRLHYNTAMLQY